MTVKIDIYEAAQRLIADHGEDAPIVAAQEADSCLENGDLDGKVAWLKVMEAIRIFQEESARPSSATIH